MARLRDDLIVICIDGSLGIAPPARPDYVLRYRNSFVRQIFDQAKVGSARKAYFQGPGGLAGGPFAPNVATLSEQARSFIRSHSKNTQKLPKVALAGWSRGACAAIQVAYDLKQDFPIECLALFDAVDNDASTGFGGGGTNLGVIPGNVVNCFHAVADIKAAGGIDSNMFPTSGLKSASGVKNFDLQRFPVSHGGVGGLPAMTWDEQTLTGAGLEIGKAIRFIDQGSTQQAIERDRKNRVEQDRLVSVSVRQWMWSRLKPLNVI